MITSSLISDFVRSATWNCEGISKNSRMRRIELSVARDHGMASLKNLEIGLIRVLELAGSASPASQAQKEVGERETQRKKRR